MIMKLVIMCRICGRDNFKETVTLPVEYASKEALVRDFMKLVIPHWKAYSHNFGKGSYFNFLGLRFEADDYYYEFTDVDHILKTPPTVLTLEEWFNDYKTQ